MGARHEPPLPATVSAVYCSRGGALCAEHVPDRLNALVVQREACPNTSEECAAKPQVGIIGGVDAAGVRHALDDFGCCVEARYGRILTGPHLAGTLALNGLYMALSTGGAYSAEPGRLFMDTLASRLGLDPGRRETIEMAVSEGISNAIVHGNLGLGSKDRQSLEGFAHYCQDVDHQLAQEELAGRCLEVFATWTEGRISVTVTDDGAGYDATTPVKDRGAAAKSGRGLAIIRSLADEVVVEAGGRSLCMTFKT